MVDVRAAAPWGDEPLSPEGVFRTSVDLQVYRLTAVKKAAYRMAAQCTVLLGALEGATVPLAFAFPTGTNEKAAREIVRLFFQELLDQELRELVGEETKPIRALVLAHAFSRTGLIR